MLNNHCAMYAHESPTYSQEDELQVAMLHESAHGYLFAKAGCSEISIEVYDDCAGSCYHDKPIDSKMAMHASAAGIIIDVIYLNSKPCNKDDFKFKLNQLHSTDWWCNQFNIHTDTLDMHTVKSNLNYTNDISVILSTLSVMRDNLDGIWDMYLNMIETYPETILYSSYESNGIYYLSHLCPNCEEEHVSRFSDLCTICVDEVFSSKVA